MELSAFSAINRFQPFNVAVSSNVLLLMVSWEGGQGGGLKRNNSKAPAVEGKGSPDRTNVCLLIRRFSSRSRSTTFGLPLPPLSMSLIDFYSLLLSIQSPSSFSLSLSPSPLLRLFSSFNITLPAYSFSQPIFLLSQDFHCHLTSSEVVGYLGGRWDTNTQRECEMQTVLSMQVCRQGY